MFVPKDSLMVEKTEAGYAATTTLLDGPRGVGPTEADAVADLDREVKQYLRMARSRGWDIPKAFHVPRWWKIAAILLVLACIAALRILLYHVTK